MGGSLIRGHGEMGGELCLQRTAIGMKTDEMGLKRRPDGGEVEGGEDPPSVSESSGGDDNEEDEDGEEGEVTLPPHSLPHKALPLFGDIFSRQMGITPIARQLKQLRTEIRPSTSSLP
jgi:hypothetical protein